MLRSGRYTAVLLHVVFASLIIKKYPNLTLCTYLDLLPNLRPFYRICKTLLNSRMANSGFDGQILVEKLSKLNNSQQSIESLSRWCISHRKKAKLIVETWDKLFNSSQKEQRISFLYLANDILQNSRRKGSEFVNEFWKVLPAVLKRVYENGDEYEKKVATRLVDIWEQRKVFGSRGQSLKDEMLGKDPPRLVSNARSLNSIKILKRDTNSVRIKIAVGGLPEKILTAFHSVHDEHLNEEAALNKCDAAVHHVGKIEEDVENTSSPGNQQGSDMLDELEEQENVLQQCVGQLEGAEATRVALVSQLKDAFQDQESKLELIRTQMQVARAQIERASNIRKRLMSSPVSGPPATTTNPATEVTSNAVQPTSTQPQLPLTQPAFSFTPMKTAEEENKKAAAAAVAAKLAASASSAQMLTSVLSSFVAEEAASMNGGLKKSSGFMFPSEKRPKLDNSMSVSEVSNPEGGGATFFTTLQQQPATNALLAPSASPQPVSQTNQMQQPFSPPPSQPPPPPLPPLSSANAPANQYMQSSGLMMGMMHYGYGANTLPPPPPLPPHIAMNLARPTLQSSQQPQPQQYQAQQQQQQQPATGGYYRPPGIGFYGPTPPPVPRQ